MSWGNANESGRLREVLKDRFEFGGRSVDRFSFVHVFDAQPFAELRPQRKIGDDVGMKDDWVAGQQDRNEFLVAPHEMR